MEDCRIAQATQWELSGCRRNPGRPMKNWMDIVNPRDIKVMVITGEKMKNCQ